MIAWSAVLFNIAITYPNVKKKKQMVTVKIKKTNLFFMLLKYHVMNLCYSNSVQIKIVKMVHE